MKTPVTTQDGIKSHELLEKVFHVLFTRSMYTAIESHSTHLNLSKGALIRSAVTQYLHNLDAKTLAT